MAAHHYPNHCTSQLSSLNNDIAQPVPATSFSSLGASTCLSPNLFYSMFSELLSFWLPGGFLSDQHLLIEA